MNKEQVQRAHAARLARLPVGNHPAFMFNPWLEGYRDYVFGGRAGPAICVRNVFHELAHAAEFGPELFRTRATADGFRFKVPRRYIYDRFCDVPRTGQGTMRELRTFAFQLHLMQAAELKVHSLAFSDHSAYIMRLMHDWYHIPGEDEEARKEWCRLQILEAYESVKQAEVLGRLEGWLDNTRKRLNRQRMAVRAVHPVELRLRPLLRPVGSQVAL
jgi:hypothetical protein